MMVGLEELGLLGHSGLAYAVSKRGVVRLVERRAGVWGGLGGRLVSLSPGILDTPMGRLEAAKKKSPDLPPVDLLLAKMYFLAGNANAGRISLEKTAMSPTPRRPSPDPTYSSTGAPPPRSAPHRQAPARSVHRGPGPFTVGPVRSPWAVGRRSVSIRRPR